jgi:hypothetical protein
MILAAHFAVVKKDGGLNTGNTSAIPAGQDIFQTHFLSASVGIMIAVAVGEGPTA